MVKSIKNEAKCARQIYKKQGGMLTKSFKIGKTQGETSTVNYIRNEAKYSR